MIGENGAAVFGEGRERRMRGLAAMVAISMAMLSAPAQASDELCAAGLAPLDDALLAMATGGAAPGLQFGEGLAVDLTAASSLQASLSHSSTRIGGALKTGDVDLGDVSGARGGLTSIQVATGFNNIQQSSAALALAF
jgi:hypothetical protein